MAYNFTKDTCDRCGVNKKDAPVVDTGINHPVYCKSKSFLLSKDGGVLCQACARERAIKGLFDLMDKRK